ncbi:MAG: hypothetical protein JO111_17980 [Caulobacteraceae bacterium]|nr:hypothetical protein [Caulobacteraceae bacterium]
MKPAQLIGAFGAACVCLAGVSAHAEMAASQAPAQVLLVANDFAAPAPTTPGRTLEWDSKKGRWGLRLGVDSRTDRTPDMRDIEPGLFYKVTPRLHIGGGVTIAPDQTLPLDSQRLPTPQAPNPRVRLETTFKF